MRAYREDMPVRQQRRGAYASVVGVAVLVLVTLLYFGLRDPAEPAPEAPLQVARDTESTLPAANTAAVQAPVAQETRATGDFVERELHPPTTAVGAGEAPVVERQSDETFVIDGELLEALEAEAAAE
jgi:hypothetical protein